MDYPVYPVTPRVIQLAVERARKIPSNIKNSIRHGEGRLLGSIGEVILMKVLGATDVPDDMRFDADMFLEPHYIDAKIKECTSPPKPHYYASIAAANISQRCDRYAFMRGMKPHGSDDYTHVFVLGWMDKKEFFEKATFNRKGEIDPSSGSYRWTFRADCYNIEISKLNPYRILEPA